MTFYKNLNLCELGASREDSRVEFERRLAVCWLEAGDGVPALAMGKGTKAQRAKQPSDDDALLDAAIAEARAEKAATEAEEETVRTLETHELVQKLNTVPMFKVFDEETGDIVPTPYRGGDSCMCWYADPGDAKLALAIVEAKTPGRKLALGTTPLGIALAMSEGWGSGLPDEPFRLQASLAVLRAVKDELEPLPARVAQALNPRSSAFPVFLMEELQSPSVSPVFFRREDLVSCWRVSGRPESEMPPTLTMYDLRVLTVKMMSTAADWRSLMFVAPQSSVDAAGTATQHPAIRDIEKAIARQAAVESGDEPPPLEAT